MTLKLFLIAVIFWKIGFLFFRIMH